MKKFLTGFLAVGAALALSTSAFAATTKVSVTSTQTTIAKEACERTGSLSFAFEKGTVLKVGDRFTISLPGGVTLCKDINVIYGGTWAAATPTVKMANTTLNPNDAARGVVDAASDLPGLALGGVGPIQFIDMPAPGGPGVANTIPGGANVYIYATGSANSNVVTVWVLAKGAASQADAIKIGTDDGDRMVLTLFDGQLYNAAASTHQVVIESETVTSPKTFNRLIPAGVSFPAVQTSMCVKAASTFTGTQVDVNYLSYDAADATPKFDFGPTYKVAVIGNAQAYETVACAKDPGTIKISSTTAQAQKNCSFAFADPSASPYCATGIKNRLLIKSTSGSFGSDDDRYTVDLESTTKGVYFGSGAATIGGYKVADDECYALAPTAIALTAASTDWDIYAGSTKTSAGASFSWPTSTCTVKDESKASKLVLSDAKKFSFSKDFDIMQVILPTMVYDIAEIGNNVEAKVKVTVKKMPCGEITNQTVKLGTFVTDCGSTPGSAGSTTLMYPFFPSMTGDDDDAGWWAGIVITNGSSASGEATLTFSDKEGKTGTIKKTVPAKGQYVAGLGSTIKVADLTAGTPAFDGKKKYSVQVVCPFTLGAGFAFLGGPAGVGDGAYKAYVLNGTNWQ